MNFEVGLECICVEFKGLPNGINFILKDGENDGVIYNNKCQICVFTFPASY